ncbi:hypothetical protein [Pleurocapsa sp. PCC 7319]|uniref:hypothetical protein n=1 Tax=Pleurocapsa sp. PCC 7319 TaxID=118161 RepID=UPI00034A3F32|nr:hypothetical protein [Pleurocapsa sp. PCC 7319]
MTKSIQQIRQDLDYLESAVASTSVELRDLYRKYLELLSQSVKQQLILASYQLCTQFYPQSFLNLSLKNKQKLQQELRKIGSKLQPVLLDILEQKKLEPEKIELNLMAELIKNLPKLQRTKESQEPQESQEIQEIRESREVNELNTGIDLRAVAAELENVEFIEIDTTSENDSEESNLDENLPSSEQPKPLKEIDFNNSEHLILWQKQIERTIKKTLDYTSKKTNKYLQEAGIIPNRIPSKIIDVAMHTDPSGSSSNNRSQQNVANILNLVLKTDQEQKTDSIKNTTQISLLRLRLAELEFSDPMLNAQRSQIRNLMGKIRQLNSKYKATQQEAAIAEAQAAWRSSWYEE